MLLLSKYQVSDFVRDRISQCEVQILDIRQCDDDVDRPYWIYYTTAGPDENYPHGHRLENEIIDRDFIGPLVP